MVFPGTMFGDTSTDYIRISYLQPLPLIEKAMERIAAFTRKTRAAA
jgi:aminotransferase